MDVGQGLHYRHGSIELNVTVLYVCSVLVFVKLLFMETGSATFPPWFSHLASYGSSESKLIIFRS